MSSDERECTDECAHFENGNMDFGPCSDCMRNEYLERPDNFEPKGEPEENEGEYWYDKITTNTPSERTCEWICAEFKALVEFDQGCVCSGVGDGWMIMTHARTHRNYKVAVTEVIPDKEDE